MNLSTLFHQCLYFCVVILIFTLSLSFISALWFDTGAIPVENPMGKPPKATSNETFMDYVENITGLEGGFSALWLLVASISGLGVTVFSIATGQTTPIAIYLFGVVFWTAWTRALSVIGSYVPPEILILFTVPIMFIFAGAIIAMLGYSG